MAEITIYSEHPVDDIWLRILRYTYDVNLAKHVPQGTTTTLNEDARREIAASLQHAHEYFRAAEQVTLHTSPLQIYYGMVNALRACAIFSTGQLTEVYHHGMTIPKVPSSTAAIGDTQIRITGGQQGGLTSYAAALGCTTSFSGGEHWSLREVLGAIPELLDDYWGCYGASADIHCIPVERLTLKHGESIDRISLKRVPNAMELLERVPSLKDRYLAPQQASEEWLILRRKLGDLSNLTYSTISGHQFLLVAHQKGTRSATLPVLFALFMAMFVLGTLAPWPPTKIRPPLLAKNQPHG